MLNFEPLLDEVFSPGHSVTARATEPIKQGQFVAVVASDTDDLAVAVAPAGARAFGLADRDVDTGELVTVQRGNARVFRLEATGLAVGQDVEVGAAGAPAVASTGVVVGHVVRTGDGTADISLV